MKFLNFLTKIKDIISDAIFPESYSCIFCGQDLDEKDYICKYCYRQGIFNEGNKCIKCDSLINEGNIICDHCKSHKRHFDRLFCPFKYEGVVRKAILKFKSDGAKYLAEPFAHFIYEKLVIEEVDFDVIIPVPSEKRKIKERGYNPAKVLADEIGKLSKKPVLDILYKTKKTKNQKMLDYNDRQTNLKDSIVISDRKLIKNKSVLIVDDIITTCATIETCSQVLKNAKNIYGCAIARSNFQKNKK